MSPYIVVWEDDASGLPQTGDRENAMLWLTALFASAAACILLALRRVRS